MRFGFDPRDTAAAGTDRLDPDFARQNTVTKNNRFVLPFDYSVTENADFESSSTHIRGQDVFLSDQAAKESASHDARGGTGLDCTDGVFARGLDAQDAAIGLHDQRFSRK